MAMYNTKLNYNGEPCTWRHVSTVRGQALGNLPQKCGKAPSAEPTNKAPIDSRFRKRSDSSRPDIIALNPVYW